MRKKRRIFFYGLAVVFIISAPLLIAISFGYRFNFVSRSFEHTGGIFVKSKTQRLSIFINGNFSKETSIFSGGALLTDIKPGTYLIRLERSGFTPWSKAVSVNQDMVTELRDVLLVPNPVRFATTTKSSLPTVAEQEKTPYSLDKAGNLFVKTATSTKLISPNVYSFGMAAGRVLFADQNGFLAEYAEDTGAVSTIGRPGFFMKNEPFQFFASPGGEVFVVDSGGGLFMLTGEKDIKALTGNVKKLYFDSEGSRALILKDLALEVLWLKDNAYQPFDKKGTLSQILSVSIPIVQAQWFPRDDRHIIFRTKEGVYMTELDGRGGRNTAELVSQKTDEIFTFQEFPGTVFYRIGKTYFQIEL